MRKYLILGSCLLAIYTAIFVRAEIINVTTEIDYIQDQIKEIEYVNKSLEVEILKLSSYQEIRSKVGEEFKTRKNIIVLDRE